MRVTLKKNKEINGTLVAQILCFISGRSNCQLADVARTSLAGKAVFDQVREDKNAYDSQKIYDATYRV